MMSLHYNKGLYQVISYIHEAYSNYGRVRFSLLSLRLMGVETLESVSRNFKRRFHFLFLVSGTVGKTYCKLKPCGRDLKFSVIKGALMQILKPPYIFKII